MAAACDDKRRGADGSSTAEEGGLDGDDNCEPSIMTTASSPLQSIASLQFVVRLRVFSCKSWLDL